MKAKKKPQKAARGRRQPQKKWWRRWLFRLAALSFLLFAGWVVLSYLQLVFTFDNRLGGTPSRLYSAPLVLAAGSPWSRTQVEDELRVRSYTAKRGTGLEPGQYRRHGDGLEIHLRRFDYGDGPVEGYRVRLSFAGNRLGALSLATGGEPLEMILVEPRPLDLFHGRVNELRVPVTLEELPPHLPAAVLAVEDRRFYSHRGLDPRGIGRALVTDILAGEVRQGGSTITQQVIKNVMLTSRRQWGRKLREMVMAPLLETLLSKDEILEIYLNEIYLGQKGAVSIVGVGAASRFFFGRDADELTVGQSALLAGMIRSPGNYNPWRHPRNARGRRDEVLGILESQGLLSSSESEAARSRELRLVDGIAEPMPAAGSFLDVVRAQLAGEFSIAQLEGDGLQIFTTLDTRVQVAAAKALQDGLARLEANQDVARRVQGAGLQGAVVVLNPETGAVLALVGDRRPGRGRFNRALDARRPVGSLFKPFVYLAALQAGAEGAPGGLTAASMLMDEPLEISQAGGSWQPVNNDNRFRGPVSLRRALADSVNIPAVTAARDVGLGPVVELAEAAGFPPGLPQVPAVALGAAEASPLDVAVAYSVLAAGGRRPQPRFWEVVHDATGSTLARQRPLQRQVVLSPAAFVITDMLSDVVRTGTGRLVAAAGLSGAVAGKTGTTNQKRDAWFAGYMPGLLAVVWIGADDNRPVGLSGSSGALPIWLDLMRRLRPEPAAGFAVDEDVVRVDFDPATGGRAVKGCPHRRQEWFISGTEPEKDCSEHRRGFWRRLFRR